MKRSEINHHLLEAEKFFAAHQFRLPEWASWTPREWAVHAGDTREIADCKLGWDITDFGGDDFARLGLLLFTIRNGINRDKVYDKPYAEKIMLVQPGQVTPIHFHWHKQEDIINRGGGLLLMRLWNSDEQEKLSDRAVNVSIDGVAMTFAAGQELVMRPGQSITLRPGIYHTFKAGESAVMAGEVSMVNDDSSDNRFYQPAGRFPAIEEDEPPVRLLCTEYLKYR